MHINLTDFKVAFYSGCISLDDYDDEIEDILILTLAEPDKDPNKSSNLQGPFLTDKWEKVTYVNVN